MEEIKNVLDNDLNQSNQHEKIIPEGGVWYKLPNGEVKNTFNPPEDWSSQGWEVLSNEEMEWEPASEFENDTSMSSSEGEDYLLKRRTVRSKKYPDATATEVRRAD